MQVLIASQAIERTLIRLMRTHDRYRWAVAWASTGFDAWKELERRKGRITQVVIGTHFHQTHPDAIRSLHTLKGVRFVTDLSGVFHHKIYMFEKKNGAWSAVIGSANFTGSAFSDNAESAVLIGSGDADAREAKRDIDRAIDLAWDQATPRLDPAWLRWYADMWNDRREQMRSIAGRFGKRHNKRRASARRHPEGGDGGLSVGDIPILRMTWKEYVDQICKERRGSSVEGRLDVLERVGGLFRSSDDFAQLSLDDRNRIAGTIPAKSRLVAEDGVDWAWFGRMSGSGIYLRTVIQRARAMSRALRCIPLVGLVSRQDYDGFMSQFLTLPHAGIATGTRLLAMKRPDIFVCLNKKNDRLLKRLFGVRGCLDHDGYWDSVVVRMQQALWWNTPCPASGINRRLWHTRAAMLDAITYRHT